MPQLHIIVCVKQVPDPEAPPAGFKLDPETRAPVSVPGFPPVISTFDEHAVEAALRIKDVQGGKITIISLGVDLLREVVKKPISMGADELILLEDPAFAGGDSWSTAYSLAAAIKKVGRFDLIFCGRQAADTDAGQVGSLIAEILGLPQVTLARKIEPAGGKLTVQRVTPYGYEVVETDMPALITVSNELGKPRYPTIRGIVVARNKSPVVWTPADLGIDPAQVGSAGGRIQMRKIFQPIYENKCEMVAGADETESGGNLAQKMAQVKLL
jgi:electron transfer flavoprotein beta subunit